MPIEHTITDENYVHLRVLGDIDAPEMVAKAGWLYSNLGKHLFCKYQIWDFSEVGEIRFSANDIRQMVSMDSDAAHQLGGLWVATAATKDVMYGLGRMYETYSGLNNAPIHNGTFRDLPSAVLWLKQQMIQNT